LLGFAIVDPVLFCSIIIYIIQQTLCDYTRKCSV